MVWVIVILIIIGIVLFRFFADYQNIKNRTTLTGGMKNKLPVWKQYFEENGFKFVKDTGSVLEYHKLFYSKSLKENCDLHLVLKGVFENILTGYIITDTGKNIKSIKIGFGGKDYLENPQDIELLIRRVMAGFETKGVLD